MSRIDGIFAKADKSRADRKLPPVRVGFDYSAAIEKLERLGMTVREIAGCIGVAHSDVLAYRNEGRVPGHITGELLYALVVDEHGGDRKAVPMSAAQRSSQQAGRLPSRVKEHRIR